MWKCSLFLTLSFIVLNGLDITHASGEHAPEGWLWYKEKPESESDLKVQEQEKPKAPKTALEIIEEKRRLFEEKKAYAILNPTVETVTEVRRLQEELINTAEKFQKIWMVSELLDHSNNQPSASPGSLKIKRQLEEDLLAKRLKGLSKNYGLIFAFKQNCAYCHKFAPLVQEFAQTYGFEVVGLTDDNGVLPGMTCTTNSAALEAINPEGEYPVLYLCNEKEKIIVPLARGYVSWNELHQNVGYALDHLREHLGVDL